jgi:hypothetical protein
MIELGRIFMGKAGISGLQCGEIMAGAMSERLQELLSFFPGCRSRFRATGGVESLAIRRPMRAFRRARSFSCNDGADVLSLA